MSDISSPDPVPQADPPVHPVRPPGKVWAWMVGMVLIVAGVSYLALRSNRVAPARAASPSALTPDKLRKKAPDFALKDANGSVIRLSDFRGKVVLVDFWATWCGPCKIEIPWFINFERQYKDKGFAIIGTAMDEEGWDVVKPFLSFMKINYRVVLGNDALADQYGIEAFPTTFLIDRDGNIAATHIGLSPKDDFEDGIVQLLQTRPGAGVPAVLVGAK